MKRMSLISALLLIVLSIISCSRNVLETAPPKAGADSFDVESLLTKSAAPTCQMDSIELAVFFQTDKDHIMINRVIFKDSVYVLGLSRSSAYDIGISKDLYGKYLEYVDELNRTL